MTSLGEALREAACRFANETAVIAGSSRVDFATLGARSDALAITLHDRGLAKGERVALACPNGLEFVTAYLAIVKCGAVVVPINLLLGREGIVHILADAEVSALIYHPQLADTVERLLERFPALRLVISTGAAAAPVLDWETALTPSGSLAPIAFNPDEDLAAILYTSGTTGQPKGAMLTHRNLLANTASVREAMDWRPGRERVLVVLPMFHAFAATVGMLTPLIAGCALIPVAKFEPEQVARVIAATHATIFLGVPSMYTMLLKLKEDLVPLLQSLRFCVSGGAALPVEVLLRFEAKFGVPIYEGDGPTECSPVTCVNPIGALVKPGTVGLPLPGVEMKIVGERGEDLEDGQVGEIAVRGANVFKGYWKHPEATAACFLRDWFLTGDLGSRDRDGYFSIVDRKKDLIIVNGMNVYPRVIEEVLHRCPDIREAAVVGEPHPLHGEIPVAFVALHQPGSMSPSAIRAWCKDRLGRHEVPRVVTILPELPRNAAGKIVKRQLTRKGEIERGVAAPPHPD